MSNILALDVGEKRIGLAIASSIVMLPRPLTTIAYEGAIEKLKLIIENEAITELVVGLPMNRNGDATQQTKFTMDFIDKLKALSLDIATVDEALSSKRAKQELQERGKPYEKGDIDALAATYILDDYLKEGATA